ncbi:hypothetical protein EHQ16_08460 [Leptospira kanakyensis]|uniref:Lipoprotein n=1 Tax=Leptospira kanakyensis TaxID=2484968 RepID=A0A6N4Q8X9_9LEPT|nr:hypothetical protein [Leptospira kanakyensis]TGK55382.1 hypothetical protein EHQ11_00635 [Leptospira kanakyensis]TGK60916.1 hypothetical protein EHQ16_08460 [Leptospira kanakyensis]TGK76609.1 hypothetical protein EHQ18_01190 [Leptospira kanakyensis]
MNSKSFRFFFKNIFAISVLFYGCIGDLYFDTHNEMNGDKVSRDVAVRQFYGALLVKRSLCPQSIDTTLTSAGYYTTNIGSGCSGSSTTDESKYTLRSCKSVYKYVHKKDLTVCLNEVLFFPCESVANASRVLRPNFPVCRGLFGPGPETPLSM